MNRCCRTPSPALQTPATPPAPILGSSGAVREASAHGFTNAARPTAVNEPKLLSSAWPSSGGVLVAVLLTLLLGAPVWAEPAPRSQPEQYRPEAEALVQASREQDLGWERLAELCTRFPHRLSGSQALEEAIDWMLAELENDGFTEVRTQEVSVPVWRRGTERLTLLTEEPQLHDVLGLGGSVSTGPGGLEADVLVVESYHELEERSDEVPGRIVLFNPPFTTYSQTVRYRFDGAERAAELGAVAALLRSIGNFSLNTPHTGITFYSDGITKIPFAAVSPETAEHLSRRQSLGLANRIHLLLESESAPDAISRNVIVEIRGSEFPEEVVLFGAHIDGWDVGEGAHDDAGGVLVCWEALRLIARAGWTPKRTLRMVIWTNEENGLRGAQAYRQLQEQELRNHVLAIESDYGIFAPSGFSFSGPEEARVTLERAARLCEEWLGPLEVTTPGGGADIVPLMQAGVPGAGLHHQDERYFWYHHSRADTLDKIDRRDFENCVALMAATVFVIADLPQRLPFGTPESSKSSD